MPNGIALTPEAYELVTRHVRQLMNSWQPHPSRGRRVSKPGKTAQANESPRLIQGKVYGNITASATTFYIDTIVPLSSGADPRTDPSSATEQVHIVNAQKEAFTDREDIVAIWYDLGGGLSGWSTLVTERFRAVRGKCTAAFTTSDATFTIDTIVVLDSGRDPRTNPASAVETLTVYQPPTAESYSDNDNVWCDYNVKDARWEARPTSGSGGGLRWGHVTTAASASSTWDTPTTDGRCTLGSAWGSTTGVALTNYYPDAMAVSTVVCIDSTGIIVTWSCGTLS